MKRYLLSKICNVLTITILSSISCLGMEKKETGNEKSYDFVELMSRPFADLSPKEKVALKNEFEEIKKLPPLALHPDVLDARHKYRREYPSPKIVEKIEKEFPYGGHEVP